MKGYINLDKVKFIDYANKSKNNIFKGAFTLSE